MSYRRDGVRKVQPSDAETGVKYENGHLAKNDADAILKDKDIVQPVDPGAANPPPTFFGKIRKAALHGVTYDIHEVVEKDSHLTDLHARAEVFQPRLESSFSYLQAKTSYHPPSLS